MSLPLAKVVLVCCSVGEPPVALVTLVRMFSCVSPPVVDQVVRSLELLATKVTSVSKLSLVD